MLACLEDLKGAITRTTEQVAGYHRQMGVLRDALYLHSQVLLGWVRWGRVAVRVGPGEAHAVWLTRCVGPDTCMTRVSQPGVGSGCLPGSVPVVLLLSKVSMGG